MDIHTLFAEAVRKGSSDLHLIIGNKPTLRIDGNLEVVEGSEKLTPDVALELVLSVLTSQQRDLFLANRELDFSVVAPSGRFRANAYYQRGGVAAAFRLIPPTIKSIDELGLPAICHDFVKLRQGLVLVTGPTGHGKSTTLASMIHTINTTKAAHVITIEDPIEFVYPSALSLISQREMHYDTHSWGVSLRSVLREDPDVVMVGEMRDLETIAATLTIAETGHLVFATLHTNSASQTIDRIVDVFPEGQQTQVRIQLSAVLEGVMSQRLIPLVGGGRFVVTEILTGTPAVQTVIREGKTHLIDNIIQTSAQNSMMTLETSLAQAVIAGKITAETALAYAVRPEDLGRLLRV